MSPGDSVVVVGASSVGLATVVVARLYAPRRITVVYLAHARLEAAARPGADAAESPGKMIADLSEDQAPTWSSRRHSHVAPPREPS